MLLGNRWRVARASLPMTASLTPAECFDHLVLGCGANDRALPRRSLWLDNRTNGRVLDPFQLFLKRLNRMPLDRCAPDQSEKQSPPTRCHEDESAHGHRPQHATRVLQV